MKKVTRNELLRSKEYWMVKIQSDLYAVIENYMKINDLNRSGLAEKTGFTKGYITQVLNGDYDHKISKLVELSLAVEKAPVIKYIDINKVIEDDKYFNNPLLSLESKPIYSVTITLDSKEYSSICPGSSKTHFETLVEDELTFEVTGEVNPEIQ